MKRSLLLSLFAVAILAMTVGQAMATISLSLNLRYTHPNVESLGGTWDLLARTDNPNGISGLSVVLDGIDFGSVTFNDAIDGIPIETKQSGSIVEFVWGYDPAAAAGTGKFLGVGTGAGSPGNVAKDDLYPNAPNSYDNMALIASGSFGGTRPAFATFPGTGGGDTAGQNWATNAMAAGDALDTIVLLGGDGVRGDSVATDGLRPGDLNRDGTVGPADLGTLGSNWAPTATNRTWAQGDINGDGAVGPADLGTLGSNWNPTGTGVTPPAVTAVPEPASALLALLAAVGCLGRRSRG